MFQPTPPARGATSGRALGRPNPPCFNPRPPRGGRPALAGTPFGALEFQPTPPARGATAGAAGNAITVALFQPTPPARGATPSIAVESPASMVSTHAPRAGGDARRPPPGERQQVSTHAPRAGGDEGRTRTPESGPVSTHAPRAGGDAGTITHYGTIGYGSCYANPCRTEPGIASAEFQTRRRPQRIRGATVLREPPRPGV